VVEVAVTSVVAVLEWECLLVVGLVMWAVLQHQLLLRAMHQCPILLAGIWSADQEMAI
jgi:hypothetical protein